MKLHSKQKQHLKSVAHALKPVVILGNNGLTKTLLAEIDQALNHHELIKIKIATTDREDLNLMAEAIVQKTGASHVALIGRILTLYRPAEKPRISLPR